MLDPTELAEAIELQRKSYELLHWVGKSLKKGVLLFDVVHDAMSTSHAAKAWIERNLDNMPEAVRPNRDQIERFARLFASYLRTSFDLRRKPPMRLTSPCKCWCPYCTYLAAADHLTPKKISRHAKEAAGELKRIYLRELARELGLEPSQEQIDRLVSDESLSPALAMAAYARELIRRMHFASQGTGVLALWREFAWKKQGSPIPGFRLDLDAILESERRVADQLRSLCGGASNPPQERLPNAK